MPINDTSRANQKDKFNEILFNALKENTTNGKKHSPTFTMYKQLSPYMNKNRKVSYLTLLIQRSLNLAQESFTKILQNSQSITAKEVDLFREHLDDLDKISEELPDSYKTLIFNNTLKNSIKGCLNNILNMTINDMAINHFDSQSLRLITKNLGAIKTTLSTHDPDILDPSQVEKTINKLEFIADLKTSSSSGKKEIYICVTIKDYIETCIDIQNLKNNLKENTTPYNESVKKLRNYNAIINEILASEVSKDYGRGGGYAYYLQR